MYQDIIEEELNSLKNLVEKDLLLKDKSNNFLEDYLYEDDFSHNEISIMQNLFIKSAKEYLDKNYNKEYCIFKDWCVHICTKEFYESIRS